MFFKKVLIKDTDLIRKIVNETMVADSTGYKVPYGENYIRLYHNDSLIREMRQSHLYLHY